MTTSGVRPRIAYGKLLVVEDEDAARRCLARIVTRYRPVRHAGTYEDGLAELRSKKNWCGLLFDVNLGKRERGGLELLACADEELPGVPTAIVTGQLDPELVNYAASRGATVISKPLGEAELLPFLQRVIAREHGFAGSFSERLNAVSRSWRLSPREHEVLAWFVGGGTREGYIAFSGMAETTLKSHVKHMLAKAAKPTLSELVGAALRRVVVAQQGEALPIGKLKPHS